MGDQGNTRDRRAHERYHLKRSFDVINRDNTRVLGKVADISIEGMMLLSTNLIQADTLYQVSLTPAKEDDNDPQINMGLDCMWVQEREDAGCWAGFKIIDIDDDALDHLQQLIDEFGLPEQSRQ